MPSELNPIVGDGIILTSIGAVPLIAYFNRATQEEPAEDAVLDARAMAIAANSGLYIRPDNLSSLD